ncbi:MAG TPA: RICIN domain-containing protein, partial [Streptosporangiaceae bacterium]
MTGSLMVRRVLIGILASGLGLLALAFAGPGTGAAAQAAGSDGVAHGLPGFRVVNLHAGYERALGHVRFSPVRGIARPAGYRPPVRAHAAGASPAACTEPNCKLVYHGGPVQHTPHVYLLLWGPNWQNDPAQRATATFLEKLYSSLGVEPPLPTPDLWSEITAQYSDKSGFPMFGQSVGVAAGIDPSTPPTGTTNAQFAAEASAIASQVSSPLTDDQVVIVTQSGTCPKGFADPNCGTNSGHSCAWHASITSGTYKNLTYTSLPYQSDSSACSPTLANGTNTQYNGFSVNGGREYADSVTDPLGNGWIDHNDKSGGEIAAKCASARLGLVSLLGGTFVLPPLFSNRTFGTLKQSCPLADVPDTLTLAKASYTSVVDTAVKTQVKVTSSSGAAEHFSGFINVPPGLTISSTGLVTGTSTTTSSTTEFRMTVDDATGAHAIIFVSWAVTTATGHLKGYKGLCADVNGSSTASGTKVVIWSCYTTAQEKWTLANGGALTADGKCLTDPHSGGAGTGLVIATCGTTASQQWSRNAKGQYVLALNKLCLTDPGASITAGTQLKLESCVTAGDEV